MVFDFFASFLNLEQEALIILECCSTGRKTASGQENVAFFIASFAGGRMVYSPSRELHSIDENISYVSRDFKVNFKTFQPAMHFAKNSCLARISAIWHAYLNQEIDITCEFKKQKFFLDDDFYYSIKRQVIGKFFCDNFNK